MSLIPYADDFEFSQIVEIMPTGFFFKDLEGRIRECNQMFLDLVGKPRKSVIGEPLYDVIPAGMLKIFYEAEKTVVEGEVYEFELNFEKDESEKSYWKVRISFCRNREGCEIGIAGTIMDVSRIKQVQGTQLKEHQLLRTVIDILPSFIYAKDSDGRFIMGNKVVSRFMGYSDPDEILGKTDFDSLPYKYAMKYYCDEQEIVASGRPKLNIVESVCTEEQGDPIWLNTTKVPLRDAEGTIIGIVGSGIDITQNKLMLDQMHELEEIVNHSHSCAFLLSSHDNWHVRFCTKTVNLFGYTEQDFKSSGLNYLDIVHPDDCVEVEQNTLQNFRKGLTTFSHDYRVKSKHGGYCWVEDQKYLREVLDDGKFVFQSLITDVSQRYKYQKERDELEIQLRQSQKLEAVGQLAAGIAHEINTPIQFISDNLQFLMDSSNDMQKFIRSVFDALKADDPAIKAMAERLHEEAKKCDLEFLLDEVPVAVSQSLEGAHRVRDIVQAMKEFSHPGRGKVTQEDINKAIRNTVTVARNEWKYVSELITDLENEVLMVPVDMGPFKQTILNLIVNAAHTIADRIRNTHMEKGTITICSKLKSDHVLISVQDTGMGMSKEVSTRVFDPFFTTKEVGKGTGQGLSMAYDIIVRKHKGKLYFDTMPGEGTTFYLELPLSQGETQE